MNPIDEPLLAAYDEKTRAGYPLGEVKPDLLERGYTEAEADAFLEALGARINQKVAHREDRLAATAALFLVAGGIVLYLFGSGKGILFIVAGCAWWTWDFISKKGKPGRGKT